MEHFIVRWAATAVGLFIAWQIPARLGLGIFSLDFRAGASDVLDPVPVWAVILVAALILTAVNPFVRPLVMFFTCLVNFLTLGLFSIVINILMVFVASAITDNLLHAPFISFPSGILAALVAAVIVGVINSVFDRVF